MFKTTFEKFWAATQLLFIYPGVKKEYLSQNWEILVNADFFL